MVAGQHGTAGAQQREIDRGLHRLGGFVDHRQVEPAPGQRARFETGQRRQDHLRPLQHGQLGAIFELARFREQLARLALGLARFAESSGPAALLALAGVGPEPQRLGDEVGRDPRLIVGCRLLIEGVLHHRGQHARRMTDAHRVDARRHQPLDEVVDRQIRRRRSQHAFAARDGPPDDFHQHRRLSRAGRAMHERDVPGAVGQLES